jgi:hypothetical protein
VFHSASTRRYCTIAVPLPREPTCGRGRASNVGGWWWSGLSWSAEGRCAAEMGACVRAVVRGSHPALGVPVVREGVCGREGKGAARSCTPSTWPFSAWGGNRLLVGRVVSIDEVPRWTRPGQVNSEERGQAAPLPRRNWSRGANKSSRRPMQDAIVSLRKTRSEASSPEAWFLTGTSLVQYSGTGTGAQHACVSPSTPNAGPPPVPRRPCSALVVGSPILLSRCRFSPLDRIWPDKSPLRASPGSQSPHRPVFPSAGRWGRQGARTGGRCQWCPCSSMEPRDVCKPAATTEDRYTGRARGQSVEDGWTSRRARSFGSRSSPMLFLGQRRAS